MRAKQENKVPPILAIAIISLERPEKNATIITAMRYITILFAPNKYSHPISQQYTNEITEENANKGAAMVKSIGNHGETVSNAF